MYSDEEKPKNGFLTVILVSDMFLFMLNASQIDYYK